MRLNPRRRAVASARRSTISSSANSRSDKLLSCSAGLELCDTAARLLGELRELHHRGGDLLGGRRIRGGDRTQLRHAGIELGDARLLLFDGGGRGVNHQRRL